MSVTENILVFFFFSWKGELSRSKLLYEWGFIILFYFYSLNF